MGITAQLSSTAYSPDQLIAQNSDDLLTRSVTLLTGTNYLRGALLGKITASGKYTTSLAAAADGSQIPDAILVDDVNALSGDVVAPVYVRGDFQAQQVIYGAGHTTASVVDGLRLKNIYLLNNLGGV